MDGQHRAAGYAESLHPGKRQNTRDIPSASRKYGAVLRTVFAPGSQLSFKYYEHRVRGCVLLYGDFANVHATLFRLRDEPFEVRLRLVRERRHRPQLGDQGFHSCLIQRFAHWTLARYWCMNCTTTAPSPTPEATRLTEPWRTSPTTKIPGTLVSSKLGSRLSVHDAGLLPSRIRSGPERMKPRSSRATTLPSHSVRGSAPMKMKRLEAGSFFLSPEGEHSTVIPVSRNSPSTSTTLARDQTSILGVFSICSIR